MIVGAGFGGLELANRLAGAPVRITIVDRRNHHLFQPLLYQVATSSLATSEIAWPIRHLMRGRKDVTTLLGAVAGVDFAARSALLDDGGVIEFDTLVLATGVRHAYFGHDEWEPFAPGLKTLEDAIAIRRRILAAFERAERESDDERRAALLTFVVIGGGPTGVELAGTIVELARTNSARGFPKHRYAHDARRADRGGRARAARVRRGSRALCASSPGAARRRRRAWTASVPNARGRASSLAHRTLAAKTILWAAGVQASPAARWLGASADRAGRIFSSSPI